MRILSLIDNVSRREGCQAAHGLSLYIELGCGAKVLFDMGPGSDDGSPAPLARNAARLGVDLSEVDIAVVSHGHCDHCGGLPDFLALNSKAPVYIREAALERHFSLRESGPVDIGIPPVDAARLVVTGEREALPYGIMVLSNPPQEFPQPCGNALLQGPDGRVDDFLHEQSMVIVEDGKAVLFGGCAHRALPNIISCAKRELSGTRLTHVFSGTHIGKGDTSVEYIEKMASSLLSCEQVHYYTMHCTGEEGFSRLRALMGPRIDYLSCAEEVVI